MKKLYIILLFFVMASNYAQTKGITYQAVIMNTQGNQSAAAGTRNVPLANQSICMLFKFVDEFSDVEYQETIQTQTDQFGMVNLIIGSGNQTGGYASSFKTIVWNSLNKNLVVSINAQGSCSTYVEISNQPFHYVPFSLFAQNAENINGVVAIENGGTNATTVIDARTNLEVNNVDNTTDLEKPISKLAQLSLDTKEILANKSVDVAVDGASNTKYPTVKAVKDYVDAQENTIALTTEINNRIAADLTKANLASPTFTGTVAGIDKTMVGLSNVDNTADADKPVSAATQTALDLKVDKAVGKGLSSEDYSTVEKTKLAAITGTNTGDQDLSGYATNTDLASKIDKVAGKGLSTEDYSTVEKTKLAAITGTNTGDQDLSSFATNSNLDLKANLASPTFTGTVAGIDKTMVGLPNVDNTADADKPVSAYTQTALDLKVDKVVGKGLSSEDYSTVEKTKLAAITGTNTGDQDLSGYATNTNLDLKVDKEGGKGLSTEDYSTVEKTKLAAITGTNTGDQDLSGYATNSNLDLKANLASPTFTGTVTATSFKVEDGTASQFLKADGTLDGSTYLTSTAGTNFVDLTFNQTISGEKTFNNDITANGLTIGKGLGQNDQNTAVGSGALGSSNADGTRNTAIGFFAMKEYIGTSFDNNTAVGYFNMIGLTTGGGNTSIGAETMFHIASGNNNTGIGNQSLIDIEGDNNVGVGKRAGDGLVSGSNNTFLGTDSRTTSIGSSISNATAIGYGAIVETDNTIQLGNTDVNLINTSANVAAASYIKLGGTSSQYLMADGSVLAVQVSAVEIADEFSATAEQTDFNLSKAPSGNCKVKMFVNGIRVSNASYSWAGTVLTYNSINNGGYDLSLNDRIQFDYYTETP